MTTSDTATAEVGDAALVAALLAGGSYEDAARATGCSRSTVARRMRDAAFRDQLDALRREVLARAADILAAQSVASVEALAQLRDDTALPPSVRARAARDLLDLAVRYRDSSELAARIAAIEDVLDLRRAM
jgi:transcriptional regulator with XRE-family HTH domain